jgi:hypothetical protein
MKETSHPDLMAIREEIGNEVVCQMQTRRYNAHAHMYYDRISVAATNSPIKVVKHDKCYDTRGSELTRVVIEMPTREWDYFKLRVTPSIPPGAWFTVICNNAGEPWYRVRKSTLNCRNEEIGQGSSRFEAAKEAWDWYASEGRWNGDISGTGEII